MTPKLFRREIRNEKIDGETFVKKVLVDEKKWGKRVLPFFNDIEKQSFDAENSYMNAKIAFLTTQNTRIYNKNTNKFHTNVGETTKKTEKNEDIFWSDEIYNSSNNLYKQKSNELYSDRGSVNNDITNGNKETNISRQIFKNIKDYTYENHFFNYYDYIFNTLREQPFTPQQNLTFQMSNYNLTHFSFINDTYLFKYSNLTDYIFQCNSSSNLSCLFPYYLTNSSLLQSTLSPNHPTHLNFFAFPLLLFPIFTVFGNILVVFSVITDRALQTVTNYFIVSLAISDVMVAVFVMPLAVYVEVSNEIIMIRVNIIVVFF